MLERESGEISLAEQAELLGISRSSLYYEPVGLLSKKSPSSGALMRFTVGTHFMDYAASLRRFAEKAWQFRAQPSSTTCAKYALP